VHGEPCRGERFHARESSAALKCGFALGR
jgi:hypothetical protein